MTEIKNSYETVFILSTKLGEDDTAAMIEKFKALISKHGEVESVDEWGKRHLAYPIAKQTEGYYTSDQLQELPNSLRNSTACTKSRMAFCVP